MEYEDITAKIIRASYVVYKQLGFGFLESVYKKAMAIELAKSQLKTEEEKPLKVYYDGQIVGDFFVDLFVADSIVVELKSVQKFSQRARSPVGELFEGAEPGYRTSDKFRPFWSRDQEEI